MTGTAFGSFAGTSEDHWTAIFIGRGRTRTTGLAPSLIRPRPDQHASPSCLIARFQPKCPGFMENTPSPCVGPSGRRARSSGSTVRSARNWSDRQSSGRGTSAQVRYAAQAQLGGDFTKSLANGKKTRQGAAALRPSGLRRSSPYQPDAQAREATMNLPPASAGVPRLRVGLVSVSATPDPVSMRRSPFFLDFFPSLQTGSRAERIGPDTGWFAFAGRSHRHAGRLLSSSLARSRQVQRTGSKKSVFFYDSAA